MTRLIDADSIPWLVEGVGEIPVITKEEIDQMPEAVIRCKDCKYWETDDDESFCSDWGAYGTGAESYCSFAKRKEE